MNITINRPNLTAITVEIGPSSVRRRDFPATDIISLRFYTSVTTDIPQFSYIDHDGERFYAMHGASVRSSKVNAQEHTVDFHGAIHWTRRAIVASNNEVSLPFFGTMDQYAELFQQCLRRIFPSATCVYNGSSNRTYETVFNGQDVYTAIIQLADRSGSEIFGQRQGSLAFDTPPAISINDAPLGRRNHVLNFLNIKSGLKEYSISPPSDQYANRIFSYGAPRNIDYNTYGSTSLRGDPFIQSGNVILGRVWETAMIQDDIYPQFIGTVTQKDSATEFRCNTINFNVNSQLLTEPAKVSFLSGDLVGYDFEIIAYNNTTRQVTIKQITNDIDRVLPGTGGAVNVGDKFTFLDIKMPSTYIDEAEQLVGFIAGEKIDQMSLNTSDVSAVLDENWIIENGIDLVLGDDVNLAITQGYYGIGRVIRIEYPLTNIYAYNVVISKKKSPGRLARIQDGLNATGYALRKERRERNIYKFNNR